MRANLRRRVTMYRPHIIVIQAYTTAISVYRPIQSDYACYAVCYSTIAVLLVMT